MLKNLQLIDKSRARSFCCCGQPFMSRVGKEGVTINCPGPSPATVLIHCGKVNKVKLFFTIYSKGSTQLVLQEKHENGQETLYADIGVSTLSSRGPKSLWMLLRRRCKIMTVARSFMLVTSSTLSRRLDFSVIHSLTQNRKHEKRYNITIIAAITAL